MKLLSNSPVFRLLGLACLIFLVVGTRSVAEPLLPFQGYLSSEALEELDGVRLVQFQLFDAPVGGKRLWAGEVHRLSVNRGLVNTVLGSKAPLHGIDFGRPTYLEVSVVPNPIGGEIASPSGASDFQPLLPRQILLPAVHAEGANEARKLLADNGVGYDWSVLFETNDPVGGSLKTERIADGSIPMVKLQDRTASAGSQARAGDVAVGKVFEGNGLSIRGREVREFLEEAITIESTGRPLWVGVVGNDRLSVQATHSEPRAFRWLIKNQDEDTVASKWFNELPVDGDGVRFGITGLSNVLVGLETGQEYTFYLSVFAKRPLVFENLGGFKLVAYEL